MEHFSLWPSKCVQKVNVSLSWQHGNGVTSKDELEAPEGWAWTSEWSVDTNRAVDEDGNSISSNYSMNYRRLIFVSNPWKIIPKGKPGTPWAIACLGDLTEN